jgi:hypothetical protein
VSDRHNEHMPTTRYLEIRLMLALLRVVRGHQLALGEGNIALSTDRNQEMFRQGGVGQAEPAFVGPNLPRSAYGVGIMLVGGTSVLYVGAVLDVVQLAPTGTADVTFAWFAAARITHGMLNWAIAKKVPWLMVTRSENRRARRSSYSHVVTDLTHVILWRVCAFRAFVYEMLCDSQL